LVEEQDMTPETLFLVLSALLMVPLSWILPETRVWTAMALWTVLAMASLSPLSALWLVGASVLTSGVMALGDRMGHRNPLTLCWSAVLVAALLLSSTMSGLAWVGASYFTLRNLHVLFDWWMGRLANPGLARHLRYQLFLPVLMAGPVNRIQLFERQCARRRWDPAAFFSGAERSLFGAAQIVVLGGWLIGKVHAKLESSAIEPGTFWQDWLLSAIDWVQLYFTFAGFSSLALGMALMMGIVLEENFNRPWAARNLIEFWSRWHITLSQWCHDYVFQPVTALTRSPVLGLMAAMVAIGLWHQVSAYYLLWALWQVAGIVATRMAQLLTVRHPRLALWPSAAPVLGPVFVMAWLSLAKPVLSRLLELSLP
jgi:alginate O-acetyltransferase complex protein AlgI